MGGPAALPHPGDGQREQGLLALLLRRHRFRLGLGRRDPGRGPLGAVRDDLPGHGGGGDPADPLVGAGDVRGLEADQGSGVLLEDGAARHGGELVGVGDAQDAAALHRGERAQGDPVRQVGFELRHAALVQALRGEQQMDAEAAPEASDHHEEVHEVAVGGEEFAELVDHHEERRQGFQRRTPGPRGLVLVRRRVVARAAQQFLTAHQLTVQGVLHAVHQGGLVGEVGDHGRGVRQILQA